MALERDDHAEILRLRERLHNVESKLVGVEFLLADLREWRAQARVQLEDLVKAEDIAEAVARKLGEKRDDELTVGTMQLQHWQVVALKWGIPTAILSAIATPIVAHFLG